MCSFFRQNHIKCIVIALLLAAFCFVTDGTLKMQFRPVALVDEHERVSVDSLRTTSSYRYSSQFNRILKNEHYKSFSSLYQQQFSTAIPGLVSTDILGANCTQMVPQGLCIAEDYMIVSAYDGSMPQRGRKKQRSVLYVLSNKDPKNREYLTTIVLPDINHVGGLAYDGKYVWIAKSTTKKCSAIDIDKIDTAVMSGRNSCELEYTATVDCGVTASFLTYYDNRLWVGTFANKRAGEGILTSFTIDGSGKDLALTKVNHMSIPCNANGVNIDRVNGTVCMSVVSSFSRVADTIVYMYELQDDDKNDIKKVYRGKYHFPPMGEELVSDGRYVYFLFESAASCYSQVSGKKCLNPVDRICAVDMMELYFWSDAVAVSKMPVDEINIKTVRDDIYFKEPYIVQVFAKSERLKIEKQTEQLSALELFYVNEMERWVQYRNTG